MCNNYHVTFVTLWLCLNEYNPRSNCIHASSSRVICCCSLHARGKTSFGKKGGNILVMMSFAEKLEIFDNYGG